MKMDKIYKERKMKKKFNFGINIRKLTQHKKIVNITLQFLKK